MSFFSDHQKIGVFLTLVGTLFTFLGVVMFLDRGFLAIGNLSFLSGVTLLLGVNKTLRFFMQRRKIKGTLCFLGGILLVLYGWALVGLAVEIFGFINLFGDFFPQILPFVRRIPYVGLIFDLPIIKQIADRIVHNGSGLPV
mmetsp:Transcript_19675/g.21891  ORF Transcript_19675/g.21891 Transcript_19675/m.21891 type:complete len:141 (+) Transcript_19675:41-463(+)